MSLCADSRSTQLLLQSTLHTHTHTQTEGLDVFMSVCASVCPWRVRVCVCVSTVWRLAVICWETTLGTSWPIHSFLQSPFLFPSSLFFEALVKGEVDFEVTLFFSFSYDSDHFFTSCGPFTFICLFYPVLSCRFMLQLPHGDQPQKFESVGIPHANFSTGSSLHWRSSTVLQ